MPPNLIPDNLEILRFKTVNDGYIVAFSYYWHRKGFLIGTAHMDKNHGPIDFDPGISGDC